MGQTHEAVPAPVTADASRVAPAPAAGPSAPVPLAAWTAAVGVQGSQARADAPGIGWDTLRRCHQQRLRRLEGDRPRPGDAGRQESPGLERLRRVDDPLLIRRQFTLSNYPLPGETSTFTESSPSRDRRSLLTAVETECKRRGFDITNEALRQIHTLIDQQADPGFSDVGDIVKALHDGELLSKKASWNSSGPTMLGKRPAWQGSALKIKPQANKDRRHVLSSSSLGIAVEKVVRAALNTSDAPEYIEDIRGFLLDHGVVLDAKATLQDAGRQAWVLLANHVGNLWMGPSDPNRVRGFIRAPLLDHAESLRSLNDEVISLAAALGPVAEAAGPGMQRHAPKGRWGQIVAELTAYLAAESRKVGVATRSQSGTVSRQHAIVALEHFAKTADLDLPHTEQHDYGSRGPDEEYLSEIMDIYLELENPTIRIFYQGGPLDRFMELDAAGELAKAQGAATARQ